nr:phospholipase-like protein [Tanacetum cinerariifolium]
MAKSNDLYDVKIIVRSSVKLLGEIKDLLERNPNRERLFRRTVFGPWLDILSHDNDNHLMHYVLQHQDFNPNLELYASLVEKQTRWFIASIQFIKGLVDEDFNVSQDDGVAVVSGNFVDLQHNSVSTVSIFSPSSHEELIETRVENNKMLLLIGCDSCFDSEGGATNPESNKDKPPTLADVLDEVRALRKEVVLVKFDDARISKLERILNDNFMFRNDTSPNGNHNAVNQGLSGLANHPMADGKNDSPNSNQNGVKKRLSCSANDPLSTCSGADILDGEVVGALIEIHKVGEKNDSPNKGLSCSANDPMSTCSSPVMENGEVAVAGMGIHKADGQNEIPNVNHNPVNKGLSCSANDHMSTCSSLDMDNGEVAVAGMGFTRQMGIMKSQTLMLLDIDNVEVAIAGMGIHKADGQNEIPNANDNAAHLRLE